MASLSPQVARGAAQQQQGSAGTPKWRQCCCWLAASETAGRLATPCSVSCAAPVRCFNIAPPPTLTHSGETKINLVVTHHFPGHFQDPIVSVTSLVIVKLYVTKTGKQVAMEAEKNERTI